MQRRPPFCSFQAGLIRDHARRDTNSRIFSTLHQNLSSAADFDMKKAFQKGKYSRTFRTFSGTSCSSSASVWGRGGSLVLSKTGEFIGGSDAEVQNSFLDLLMPHLTESRCPRHICTAILVGSPSDSFTEM